MCPAVFRQKHLFELQNEDTETDGIARVHTVCIERVQRPSWYVKMCWEKPGWTLITNELTHNLMKISVKVENFTGYENVMISCSKVCKAFIRQLIIKEKAFQILQMSTIY